MNATIKTPLVDKPFARDILSARESFEMSVYQSYLNGLKAFWRGPAYQATLEAAKSLPQANAVQLEMTLQNDPGYFLYSWLERRMQQFKYSGRWGFETMAERHRAEIEKILPETEESIGARERTPYYITEVDVHQHPGGLWSSVVNAIAHEWYQGGASFSGVTTDTMVAYFAGIGAKYCPEGGRILDVGTTSGRMAVAMKRLRPDAQVIGIDVCEPSIRLAKTKAELRGDCVIFSQVNSENLPYDDCSFDYIGSHWQFHELPKAAIINTLDEFSRVIKPGGYICIFDMYHIAGDEAGMWLHEGYGIRNNEPYAPGYCSFDMKHELESRGFTEITMRDFDPSKGTDGWIEELPPLRTHYQTSIIARKA